VSDEAILIIVLLGGIAVMCVVLLRYQRGKEARLAALTEIEIPIQSVFRSVLVIVPSCRSAMGGGTSTSANPTSSRRASPGGRRTRHS
jgi:hypothetical protein